MSSNSTDSGDISNSNIFPYGGCPVENITGVWRFQRPPLYKDATSSIPGHLLHYIISGSYKVSIGKKQYYPKKGDILYYYGSEQVVWIGDNSYVDFYSVGFTGTAVPVLSAEERIVRAPDGMDIKWDKLWEISKIQDVNRRASLAYSILLDILTSIFWKTEESSQISITSGSWQKIENLIRSSRLYHISPELMAEKGGFSRASLYKVCRKETGSTPLQRLKKIRTEEARGLLKYTEMRIGEISDYLGYIRIHDFSREFKNESGVSPRTYRQNSNPGA